MTKSVKPEKILESLKKLYEKRKVLDQQILETEKSFLSAAPAQPGIAVTKSRERPKKTPPASKKPPARKGGNKES
jgi:hypothetical protein